MYYFDLSYFHKFYNLAFFLFYYVQAKAPREILMLGWNLKAKKMVLGTNTGPQEQRNPCSSLLISLNRYLCFTSIYFNGSYIFFVFLANFYFLFEKQSHIAVSSVKTMT